MASKLITVRQPSQVVCIYRTCTVSCLKSIPEADSIPCKQGDNCEQGDSNPLVAPVGLCPPSPLPSPGHGYGRTWLRLRWTGSIVHPALCAARTYYVVLVYRSKGKEKEATPRRTKLGFGLARQRRPAARKPPCRPIPIYQTRPW